MPKKTPDVLDFEPQPVTRLATGLQRFWHSPRFYGWENIDRENPSLFVGNHTIYGLIDAPLIIEEVYAQTGVFLRSMAD